MARERSLAALAARQHGVVTRAQLRSLGFSRDSIDFRVRIGRFHVLHRGVYLMGHGAAPAWALEMAASLACGEGAVVSHRSAAELWQLLPYPAGQRLIHVTVTGDRRRRPGIRVHRMRLEPHEITTCRRIPVTTPARTLLDLAAGGVFRDFERALAEAQIRRLVRRRELAELLQRNQGRRGSRVLRAALAAETEPVLTRSEAEERLLELVRHARLPPPEGNVRLGRYEVDLLWRKQRLIVEIDGFRFHSSRAAFERDRIRDAELQANGFQVIRVTWRQIVREPDAMLARIARLLAAVSRS